MKKKVLASIIHQLRLPNGLRLWAVLGMLLLLAKPVWATGVDNVAAADLSSALNPDGTVRAGVRGSFDASGFALGTTPDGRPTFRPAVGKQVLGTQGAGDANWSDGFGANGIDNPIAALAIDGNGNLYAGGGFTMAGCIPANRVAKWNGTAWSALGTGANSSVFTVVASNSGLYAGGAFTAVGDGSKFMAHMGYYSFTPITATTTARPAINISLYPNPARTSVAVQVPAIAGASRATLTLLDALGRPVRTQRLTLPAVGTTTEMPLAGLAPGLYQLRVQAGSQQVSRALVVE